MNKTVLLVIGALIIVGAGYFLVMNPSSQSIGTTQNAQPGTPTDNAMKTGSFADIVAMGSVQCQVTNNTDPKVRMSGTVYVASGKMRGDFGGTTPAGAMEMHMISDGQTMYTWNSMMKGGMKMAVTKPDAGATNPTEAGENPYNQQVSYSCAPWSADASKFIVPTDITFSDFSAMKPASAAPSTNASGVIKTGLPNCSICDQAGTGRDQCRAALGCK